MIGCSYTGFVNMMMTKKVIFYIFYSELHFKKINKFTAMALAILSSSKTFQYKFLTEPFFFLSEC